MKAIRVQRCAGPFVFAAVLLIQLSPARAAGQPDGQQAAIQGSRVPGMPVTGTETTKDRRRGPVDVTFTKWRTAVLPPTGTPVRRLFKGFVGGDLGAGNLVAEVLDRETSTLCTPLDPPCPPGVPTITPSITAIHAIYEVIVGERSFTALIKGGSNDATGAALLDGVILAGWRTGAQVHVAFQTMTNCADAPAGTCFQGVIRIERAPEE